MVYQFESREIRAYAAGDGAISFVEVGRLARDERGVGRAGAVLATGRPLGPDDVSVDHIKAALRSDPPSEWLRHADAGGVKLYPLVTRVGEEVVLYRGRAYRYDGESLDRKVFSVPDCAEGSAATGERKVSDQSAAQAAITTFLALEAEYAAMTPVVSILR